MDMKKYIIAFVLFTLSALLLGPFIASTSGADSIILLANIVIFASLVLVLVFGILSVVKSTNKKWLKVLLIVLVIIATIAVFVADALLMS